MSKITIRKHGGFYHVFDNDCYILYYLFNYKIINQRLGFPLNSLTKVINKLEDLNINYEILGEIDKNFNRKNNYNKYLKLGITKFKKEQKYLTIYNSLDKLTEEDLDKIINFVSELINEK